MAIEIFMPALSPTMEEGTLATWLVKEGDSVSSGDVIAEIETDKATMEVESIDDGVMAKIIIEAGTDNVPVGQIIAVLAEEDEDPADVAENAGNASPAQAADNTANQDEPEEKDEPTAESMQEAKQDTSSATNPSSAEDSDRIKASPLAKRIAEQKGLDLSTIEGSGPNGRIVKRDVESAEKSDTKPTGDKTSDSAKKSDTAQPPATPQATNVYPPHDDIPLREERLSNMRKTIAKRLTESKTTVPHFYLTIECELDDLLAKRKELNEKLADSGVKLSVNDFIIRASALALKKVPAANVQFAGDKMYWYERADISMAVAIDGGLVTPVIRGADQLGLSDIAKASKELATKARDGKLMPEDYAGGTFSISNLGMFGIKEFSAVINPPQGAILAIGAGEQRPVVKDGALSIATVMSCTMSCDHRAVDGAVGAQFLAAFKGYIEDPITMLL